MTTVETSAMRERLEQYGQDHLLEFWDELTAESQDKLSAQIQAIDFELLSRLVKSDHQADDWDSLAARAVTPPAIRLTGENKFSTAEAREAGVAALRQGKVGIILVAGGQGSRLGFDHPKGMYPIGPISNRTLFQIHADRIQAAESRYETKLPLFLMTSPATHQETVEYFKRNDQCGLSSVSIFCQGTMPAVDAATGKVLLAEKGKVFESPDGHGGTLGALDRSGCLDAIKAQGIELLFYFQVDNPMIDIAAAEFIGYHVLSGSEMTSQVVAKQDPFERVGVVVEVDGEMRIIEYSDLPEKHASRRDDDGGLSLWAGSIAVHVFDVAFLDREKNAADALPFHQAKKKVAFVDTSGKRVEPAEPNAIKFERFIFDLLPKAKNGIVVEVAEKDGFAALKNAAGAAKDTEETVQAAIVAQHRSWLQSVGCSVADGVRVEINPKFAMDAAQLGEKMTPDATIAEDTYLSADA